MTMSIQYSPHKALLFALVFQLYPIASCLIVKGVNPNATPISMVGIFAIAEILLFILLSNWKQKSSVVDERELQVRLKVKALTLRTVEVSSILALIAVMTVAPEIPAWVALLAALIPAVFAEAIGNVVFRKI